MSLFLLIFPFLFIFLTLKKRNLFWRESFIISAVLFGTIITGITEFLSIFSYITYMWLILTWSVLSIVSFIFYRIVPLSKVRHKRFHFPHFKSLEKIWIVSILLIVLTIGFIAIKSAPNNGDSMSYHLPRVMHWIQNHNINYYPAGDLRQLKYNPWAEFAIMHVHLLGQTDRFDNLVQYFAMIGSIVTVSLIAQFLGANTKGQVISGVFTATLFMGILQASSTQNDYVTAFWLTCFVYFLLNTFLPSKRKKYLLNTILMGISLGLAFLTKGTAYVYASPFLLWLVYQNHEKNLIRRIRSIFIAICIILILNSGFFLRNYNFSGSFLDISNSSADCYRFLNGKFTLPLFASNLIKNISLHIGTPFPIVNNILTDKINNIHTFFHVNINDPNISWGCGSELEPQFHILNLSNHEDTAGNPLHLFLIIIIAFVILYHRKMRNKKFIRQYLFSVLSGFFLFCLLIKWMIWNSRLHLPFFVLSAPLIGVILGNKKIKNVIQITIITLLIIISIPWVILNWSKPLIALPKSLYDTSLSIVNKDIYKINKNILNTDWNIQYFVSSPGIINDYYQIINFLDQAKCYNIGLLNITEEYELWVLISKKSDKFRIENMNVQNISNQYSTIYPFNNFHPCAIVEGVNNINNTVFNKNITNKYIWISNKFNLFLL